MTTCYLQETLGSKTSEFHRCCLCHNNACGNLLPSGAGVLCSLPRHRLFPVHLWISPGPSCSLRCSWHLLSGQVGPDKTSKVFYTSVYYRWTNSTSGKPYASFQGVRYAQPPLGELRCLILFFQNCFKFFFEGSVTLSLFWLVRSCTMCQRSRLSSVRNLAG